jgi:hypothetical protein
VSEGIEADWPRTAKLFERFLLEQKVRVLQPPRERRPLAARQGKIDLERVNRQIHFIGACLTGSAFTRYYQDNHALAVRINLHIIEHAASF